jgi:Peptidase A4 family
MLKHKLGTTDTRVVRVWLSTAMAMFATLLFAPGALADTSASANWSGYAVHRPGVSFRKVSASWKQPTAACSAGRPAYSAYWVGLGGFNPTSTALEQIGTETDCDAYGKPRLSAWYELVPSPSRPIMMTVRSGDTINASVTVVGHRATLILNDLTRRTRFARTFAAASIDVSSAEWIVEAPSQCINIDTCQTLPLANFGTARFTGATAQGSQGHLGTIAPAPWSNTKIVLTPSGRRFVTFAGNGGSGGAASPSGLSAGGSAFTVTFSSQSNPFMTVRSAAAAAMVPPGRLYH